MISYIYIYGDPFGQYSIKQAYPFIDLLFGFIKLVRERIRSELGFKTMASCGTRFVQLILTLFVCFATLNLIESHDTQGASERIDFSYSGSNGPEKWGNLSPKYVQCAKGKAQSPINIVTNEVVKNKNLKSLVRNYKSTNATLINNGFNIGMKYNHDVGVLSIDGRNYALLQMHWHTPSEHRIDGEQFPAELHLVHMSDQGSLAVVSILFKYGNSDPTLSKLKDELEEIIKKKCQNDEESQVAVEKVNVKYLRKNTKKYYRYIGSLTTPPCSENVIWNIVTKVKTISKEQVELLKSPLDSSFKNNCRPVQSLNGRKVEIPKKSDDDEDDGE